MNISLRQPQDQDNLNWVNFIARVAQSDPELMHLFQIEVTESTILDETRAAARTLSPLSELGVKIALDDFGTGYSSLGQLDALPIDVLKIDRSLIMNLETDRRSPILKQGLNFEIVAERIENEAQPQICRAHQCDYLQGYFYPKPGSQEDFLVRLAGTAGDEDQPT